jgi:hypothetical protein
VGDEEKTALAVADAAVLALQPGRMVSAIFRACARFVRMFEWIFDHGHRDLPCRRCIPQPFAGATIIGLQQEY